MAACGNCGRPITFFEVDGKRLAFNPTPEILGEGRYSIGDDGRAVSVRPGAEVYAHQLHSETCGKGVRQ